MVDFEKQVGGALGCGSRQSGGEYKGSERSLT